MLKLCVMSIYLGVVAFVGRCIHAVNNIYLMCPISTHLTGCLLQAPHCHVGWFHGYRNPTSGTSIHCKPRVSPPLQSPTT
jgi:hypothetical protein